MPVETTETAAVETKPMSPADATDAVLTEITRGIGLAEGELFSLIIAHPELFPLIKAHLVCHPKQEDVLSRKARICDDNKEVVLHLTESIHPRISQPGEEKSASVLTHEISIRGRVHTLMIQYQPGDESRILAVEIEDDGTLVTPDEKWHLEALDSMRSTVATELQGALRLIEDTVAQKRAEISGVQQPGE